jgi:hypothetical protein
VIGALLLAASLAATPPRAPAAADAQGGGEVIRVLTLLADEDVDGARAVAEPLLAARPGDPGAKLAVGVLRLYEQRYEEAASLIEGSAAGDPAGYLTLARAAR